jgi:protoheme IX farnesyltransferase
MTAVTLSVLFIWLAVPVWQRMAAPEGDKMLPEKKLFKFSIYYLFALFAALVIDRVATYQGWVSA